MKLKGYFDRFVENIIFRYKFQLIVCSISLNIIFIFIIILPDFSFEKKHSNQIERKNFGDYLIKNDYDCFSVIEFNVRNGSCHPIYKFNSTQTIQSMENMTDEIFDELFSNDILFSLNILKFDISLDNLDEIQEKEYFGGKSRLICDYTFRLFIGIRLQTFCNESCQTEKFKQIEERIPELANIQFHFNLLSKKYLILTPIEYFIQNLILYRTCKYYEEYVYIKSLSDDYYISLYDQKSFDLKNPIIMSAIDRSLFLIRRSLDIIDQYTVTVSFLSMISPSLYLRHERGQMKLSKREDSILFQQDASFQIHFNFKENFFAFQPVNLQKHIFVTFTNDINRTLLLAGYPKDITIQQLPVNALFTFVPTR